MTARRAKGDGGLVHRHDHPTCPPLGSGEPDEDGKPTRAKHTCKGRWVGTIDVELPNGRTTRKSFYGRTQAEAKKKLDQALRDKRAGNLVAKSPTVESWLETWMQGRRRPPKPLKPNTWNGYAEKIRNYIVPAIGRKRLDQLRPQQIEAIYNDMRDRGLAEATVRQVHAILSKSLKDAERKGLLGTSPIKRVDPPGTETNDREQFTFDQAVQALKAAGDSARWWLALFYGMRQGEVLGMDWSGVDWTNQTFTITETLQQNYGGGERIKGTPKSKTSQRELPMLPQIEVRLRLLWENSGQPLTGPVFPNAVGKPLDPAADWKSWRAFIDSATVVPFPLLPYIALHAARNSAASLMEAAGIADRVIAQILGHAQVRITHNYQRAEIKRMRAELERAAALVELGFEAQAGTAPGPPALPS